MFQVSNKYIQVGGLKVHVRILGAGPGIVLFHPSPHTSKMMLPIAQELASHYTVICVDTPGYGASDPLKKVPIDLSDYTALFHGLFTALQLEKPVLYGSATGAQIAIRYALDHPENVSHVFLDNSAHFEDDLRNEILKDYFPNLQPQLDGSHLKILWDMVSKLFQYFPWCFESSKYKLDKPEPTAEVLHYVAAEFLRAGEHYHYAYRAAFMHENAGNVQRLRPNTTIFRWEGSTLLRYIDDLLAFDMPEHINVAHIPADASERILKMTAYIKEKASTFPKYKLSNNIGLNADGGVQPKIEFHRPLIPRPTITADGDYLQYAWERLRTWNPTLSPEELQACLLDWYATAK